MADRRQTNFSDGLTILLMIPFIPIVGIAWLLGAQPPKATASGQAAEQGRDLVYPDDGLPDVPRAARDNAPIRNNPPLRVPRGNEPIQNNPRPSVPRIPRDAVPDIPEAVLEAFPDDEPVGQRDADNKPTCPICVEDLPARVSIARPCNHRFCLRCLEDWVNHEEGIEQEARCPVCVEAITRIGNNVEVARRKWEAMRRG